MSQLDDRSVTQDQELIKSLDPLRADGIYRKLPELNSDGKPAPVIQALRALTERARESVTGFTAYQAVAAMRDIGLVLGSVRRLGLEPVQAVPEVEPVLLALADLTGMVPRETVYHYTVWNPTGHRQRSFTGDPQETVLFDSARLSLKGLPAAVRNCAALHELRLSDPRFATHAREIADGLGGLEAAMEMVIKGISPVFFARVLRPYYEAVQVGGGSYPGGAGAGLPVPLADLALWASDHSGSDYEEFWRDGVPYTLTAWQPLYDTLAGRPSVVTRLVGALRSNRTGRDVAPELRASAVAIQSCLRALVIFRAKHLTIARKAYRADLRLYEVGSSGGSIDLLNRILLGTRDNVTLSRQISDMHGKRGSRRSSGGGASRNTSAAVSGATEAG